MSNHVLPSDTPGLVRVEGRFYRSVDARFRSAALAGSASAGRYSTAEERVLYLSASPDGVEAAMLAHSRTDTPAREVVAVQVIADRIFDLRDGQHCAEAGIDPADAAADWQQDVARGVSPPSWRVAQHLREIGAHGLIDPSRKAPSLWHLVLFAWNRDGAPQVTAIK